MFHFVDFYSTFSSNPVYTFKLSTLYITDNFERDSCAQI